MLGPIIVRAASGVADKRRRFVCYLVIDNQPMVNDINGSSGSADKANYDLL